MALVNDVGCILMSAFWQLEAEESVGEILILNKICITKIQYIVILLTIIQDCMDIFSAKLLVRNRSEIDIRDCTDITRL